MFTARHARILRGVAAGMTATLIALLFHVAGGGATPHLLGVLAPLGLSVTVSTALVGRRLSLPRLSLAVATSQIAFHSLFMLGATQPSLHAAHTTAAAHTAPMATGHGLGIHLAPDMWFAHSIAALITIAALYRGERALARLFELSARMLMWMRRRIAGAIDVVALEHTPRLVSGEWSTSALSDHSELTRPRYRGPPALLAA